MDVTPMSLQMVVPRATEASQVQHNLNQAANLQQQFETMRQEADAKLKESQVRGKDNPEDGRIKDDPNRHGQGGYEGGGRKRKNGQDEEKAEEDTMAVDPTRGHHLDISF